MQPNNLQNFDALKAEVNLFVEPIRAIKVTDKSQLEKALEIGRHVKVLSKKIEDRRVELVSPLNEQVKKVNAYAKEIQGPLSGAEEVIKRELRSYEQVLEKEREAERKRIAEEQKKREQEAVAKLKAQKESEDLLALLTDDSDQIAEPDKKMASETLKAEAERMEKEILSETKTALKTVEKNAVTGARKVWKFEVLDPDEVPRKYLVVDEKLVRDAVKVGIRDIGGVRIYEETEIALRRG